MPPHSFVLASLRRASLVLTLLALGALPRFAYAEEPAHAAAPQQDVLAAVKHRLKPFETLQGHFEQEKRLAKIKKPLKSRGSFVLQRGRGVLWRTEAPISSLLAMTRDSVAVVRDGKTVASIGFNEQPALRLMGRVVFAVFAADLDEIQKSFDVTSSSLAADGSGWALTLRPKDPAFSKVIRSIQLNGSAYLENLELQEANGDSTLIRFRDLDAQAKLRPEDARLLEPSPSPK